jgi:hypothetical protein
VRSGPCSGSRVFGLGFGVAEWPEEHNLGCFVHDCGAVIPSFFAVLNQHLSTDSALAFGPLRYTFYDNLPENVSACYKHLNNLGNQAQIG